jgi:DNA-binding response OmpR family regulator
MKLAVLTKGRVLVVEPDLDQALTLRDALLGDGYVVEVVHTFEAAVRTLTMGGIGVLVTAVRLAAFNGLHLIIRTRALDPRVRSIVVGLSADRSADITRLGVPFLQKPVAGTAIAAAVSEEMDRAAALPQRRWPRKPVQLAGVVSDTDIDIIDLSYGGLRFQGAKTPVRIGSELTVNVPSLGVSLTAVARWTKPVHRDGVSWCGAEILNPPAGTDWRGVVDSLR